MLKTPPRTIMEVFRCLPEGTLAQVVNNQLIMSPAPNSEHQRLSRKIAFQLNAFVETNELGEVFYAPIDVYFDAGNVYQPAILFVARKRFSIVKDNIYGAPDLIIELLSPGSEKLDRVEKREVYERYGVKEYWIVDPKTKKVLGYQLSGGRYEEIPAENGVINSLLLQTIIHF